MKSLQILLFSKEIFTHPVISDAGMLESITSVLRKVKPALRSRSTSHFIDYLLIILTFCQDSLLSTKLQRDPNISVINKLWCWARAEIYFSQNVTFCWEWRMLLFQLNHRNYESFFFLLEHILSNTVLINLSFSQRFLVWWGCKLFHLFFILKKFLLFSLLLY